ncbi:MAG TPA: ribosome-associated translation inhibitor RaiA [Candidatus Limnocylindrales bacterium]|nr:ribosome-associated translation inhibitor RaiA [Candidatus Limnocylindrales bacterium]
MSEITVSVTFRHIESTAALKKYAEEKIHKIGKYFSHPLDAHVILAVDAKQRQLAEVELHTHGAMIHGKEQHQDLYAAIDLVLDKIERQVRKHKEKSKVSRRRTKA